MHIFLSKQKNVITFFLFFTLLSIVFILFNISFPHEAFAMSPPQDTDDVIRSFNPDTYIRHELDGKPILKVDKPKCWYQGRSRFSVDYYGRREYQGRDAYGYFHPPQNLDKATQVEPLSSTKAIYDNPYDTSNNPDYQLSDNRTNSNHQEAKCKSGQELDLPKAKNVDYLLVSDKQASVYELDGKVVYKSVNTSYDKDELHFWSTGQCITSDNPVHYYFEPKHITFELDADCYEDTISTNLNSTRFNEAIEFVRNYKVLVDHPNTNNGVLSNINLGVKITRNNIVFLYLKFQEKSRRKILWTIWEKHDSKYESYKHFKRSWDSSTGIWSKIRKDVRENIRSEVEDLLGVKKINKNLKRSVKTEVERLLREKQPFKF